MKRKTKEEFIKNAIKVHNYEYDYTNVVYLGNKMPISIFCKKCNCSFNQRPDNHLSGSRCFNCYGNKKYSNNEFIELVKMIHKDIYGYENTLYNGMSKYISILCKTHGYFRQKAINHVNGQGCIKCSHIEPLDNYSFISKSEKLYGKLYDYSLVNINGNNKSKVKIICNIHGVFEKSINSHLRMQGCPKCVNNYKGESILDGILIDNNILFERQKSFKNCKRINLLYYDFYLSEYNTCVEIDGIQHFKPVKIFGGEDKFKIQIEIDKIKENYCDKNGINLIRIKYIGYSSKLKSIIISELKNNNICVK